MSELEDRSRYLVDVFNRWVNTGDSILEIGCGDGRNVRYLRNCGWKNVTGIDKGNGNSIEEVGENQYDVIFTMSTLFLIPEENKWVFNKIARMARKLIITIEGETSKGNGVIGRDYTEVFSPLGFSEVEKKTDVFNQYGVLRVLKRV